MSDMGMEMRKYFLGPMPATEFLNTFFPKQSLKKCKIASFRANCFDTVISCETETQAYVPFVSSSFINVSYS